MQIGPWNVHRRDIFLMIGAVAATVHATRIHIAHPQLALIIDLVGTFLAAIAHPPRNIHERDREDDEALDRLADDGGQHDR